MLDRSAAQGIALADRADYLVVNVSSPNTPGLRDLQAVERLRPLLAAVREVTEALPRRTPLLVKIAPDLADEDVDAVADLAVELGLDGIIATNTTIRRDGVPDTQPGGLSGRPLKQRSLAVLRRLRARVGDRMLLVAAGGVEDAEDAWHRIAAGATLVQLYTGFVYGGPGTAFRIARGLAERARSLGYARVQDAVGSDARSSLPGAAGSRPSSVRCCRRPPQTSATPRPGTTAATATAGCVPRCRRTTAEPSQTPDPPVVPPWRPASRSRIWVSSSTSAGVPGSSAGKYFSLAFV